jgi:hypothetical protein
LRLRAAPRQRFGGEAKRATTNGQRNQQTGLHGRDLWVFSSDAEGKRDCIIADTVTADNRGAA